MNLHDIAYPMENIQLISEYCAAYYAMNFRVADTQRHVEYQTYVGDTWSALSERDTLTYTNAALDWVRNGRPTIR